MSDPIRSISQNNYILATQQEVSHDNTLTGNGTPESPLGVANSSDETVLWEGENGELMSANNYTVNLADDPLSYNRIGIYGRPHENAGCQNYVEFDPSYSAVCKTVTTYVNTTTPVWSVNTYSFSGNSMTLLSQTHIWGTQSGSGGLWIYKVVGIDRKEV